MSAGKRKFSYGSIDFSCCFHLFFEHPNIQLDNGWLRNQVKNWCFKKAIVCQWQCQCQCHFPFVQVCMCECVLKSFINLHFVPCIDENKQTKNSTAFFILHNIEYKTIENWQFPMSNSVNFPFFPSIFNIMNFLSFFFSLFKNGLEMRALVRRCETIYLLGFFFSANFLDFFGRQSDEPGLMRNDHLHKKYFIDVSYSRLY